MVHGVSQSGRSFPAKTWLAIQNAFRGIPERREDSFRIVLCWLQNDSSGRDSENVEDAFAGIDGIELVRSAKIVHASGAADQWRRSMRRGARAVIELWNADIALVGLVPLHSGFDRLKIKHMSAAMVSFAPSQPVKTTVQRYS